MWFRAGNKAINLDNIKYIFFEEERFNLTKSTAQEIEQVGSRICAAELFFIDGSKCVLCCDDARSLAKEINKLNIVNQP